jgi:hypothetical protein
MVLRCLSDIAPLEPRFIPRKWGSSLCLSAARPVHQSAQGLATTRSACQGTAAPFGSSSFGRWDGISGIGRTLADDATQGDRIKDPQTDAPQRLVWNSEKRHFIALAHRADKHQQSERYAEQEELRAFRPSRSARLVIRFHPCFHQFELLQCQHSRPITPRRATTENMRGGGKEDDATTEELLCMWHKG